MSDELHDSHDPLRDLIHQSLVSDKLTPSAELRTELEQRLDGELVVSPAKPQPEKKPHRRIVRAWHMALVVTAVLAVMVYLSLPEKWRGQNLAENLASQTAPLIKRTEVENAARVPDDVKVINDLSWDDPIAEIHTGAVDVDAAAVQVDVTDFGERAAPQNELTKQIGAISGTGLSGRGSEAREFKVQAYGGSVSKKPATAARDSGPAQGRYGVDRGLFANRAVGGVAISPDGELQDGLQDQYVRDREKQASISGFKFGNVINDPEAPGTEQYAPIHDNPFLPAKDAPLSTFSIDVDTASYANVRRFLTQGQVPPADAVRIEELLNYFTYDYPAPKGDEPFSVNMETAPCPWREEHLLLRVGLKGKEVHKQERPASNLVFLIDTSGSMSDEDKLPLVKQAMSMLTRELGDRDRITIITYAGEAGLKLAPTNGGDHSTITSVINSLNSNGSTHGSAGIQLAYEKARESLIKEGTNRVILCTDGDLNVGVTQDDQLVDLISKEAKSGVFLTVLGFGQGNLKDSKMEKLADHGNGVYAYIDGVREAKKVLVDQLSGSLTTIAKDVKIQIEFNPAQVRSYRLIGYENRVLAAKDFNDDTKDAGEIGAGHTVTALYELVPAGAAEPKPVLDDLKYQRAERAASVSDRSLGEGGRGEEGEQSRELLTLKLRFKQPDGDVSKKIEYPLSEQGTRFNNATPDFRFAASVAAFGMILRDSPHRGGITMAGVGEIAASSLGDDAKGYRAEFLDLVRRAEKLGKR